ncbi:hypothetical protein ACIQ1D_19570 [Lysinibacillus xylanilyticus]
MAKLTIEGKEKEVKFITVDKKSNDVHIAFTDQTMILLENVRVNVIEE